MDILFLLLQVHPLLLAERAETCTVWLLRYTLHVTSAPSFSAHKGKTRQIHTDRHTLHIHRHTDRQTFADALTDTFTDKHYTLTDTHYTFTKTLSQTHYTLTDTQWQTHTTHSQRHTVRWWTWILIWTVRKYFQHESNFSRLSLFYMCWLCICECVCLGFVSVCLSGIISSLIPVICHINNRIIWDLRSVAMVNVSVHSSGHTSSPTKRLKVTVMCLTCDNNDDNNNEYKNNVNRSNFCSNNDANMILMLIIIILLLWS